MQTLKQITQEVIAQVSGATMTDESKFEESFVDMLVHQVRAELFLASDTSILNDAWQYSYYPEYYLDMQATGECYVSFTIPSLILLENGNDTITYLGSRNGMKPFNRIGLLGDISIDMAHPITNPYKKGPVSWALSQNEALGMVATVYGNSDIENIKAKGVWYNPTDLPNYRRDTDNYPITGEMIMPLKTGVFDKLMQKMAQTPQDTLSNSADLLNDIYKLANQYKSR